jgi:ureidoacrylate peracid hydrolase
MPYSDEHDPYRGLRGIRDAGPASEQAALIVIDMQNCFLHPEGTFGKLGVDIRPLREAIRGCVALAAAARGGGVPVIHVHTTWRPDYRDAGLIWNELKRPMRDTGALVAGTWDALIVEELTPEPDDFVVIKHRYSAFYGTDLEVLLSSLRTTSVVICGVTTNICVETTARDAAQRNYRTYVVADATAEVDAEKHDHALSTLEYAFCRIVRCDEVLDAWSAVAQGTPALLDA